MKYLYLMPIFALFLTMSASGQWKPAQNTTWNYQIGSTPTNLSVHVKAYDIDGFDNDALQVAAIHSAGAKAICYVDVGTWENWRPDASRFPKSVLGATNGWPGERWLDIRQLNVLSPIITARFQMCRDKGFDAIEADNVDGYTNKSGFPLTAANQLAYNRWYAGIAHSLGLPIALKNDVDQVPQLVSYFDFMLDEQCFEYGECSTLLPFINAGKAVFEVEYKTQPSKFCPTANAMKFSAIKKSLSLDAQPLVLCQ
jgi:hypothetical protein